MSTFADRLNIALEKRNMTAAELSRLAKIPEATISQYRSGLYEPKQRRLAAISKALNTSISWLMCVDDSEEPLPSNIIPMPKMRKIPLLGEIACGVPIYAEENFDGEVDIPDNVIADFALKCKGDSMINARIYNGDTVYIRKQSIVENGEIAAVLIDDEATLKRVWLFNDHISLEAENPTVRPFVYWNEDMNNVRIIGKAVAFTSVVR